MGTAVSLFTSFGQERSLYRSVVLLDRGVERTMAPPPISRESSEAVYTTLNRHQPEVPICSGEKRTSSLSPTLTGLLLMRRTSFIPVKMIPRNYFANTTRRLFLQEGDVKPKTESTSSQLDTTMIINSLLRTMTMLIMVALLWTRLESKPMVVKSLEWQDCGYLSRVQNY